MEINDFLQRNSRKLIAVGIVLFALFAGTLLLSSASSTAQLWGAKRNLSAGTRITSNDLEIIKGSLGDKASKYFSSKAKLEGSYVTISVAAGELIPVSSVRKTTTVSSPMREVPLGINRSDIPINLTVGEYVDLYTIPQKGSATDLVVSHVSITKVDNKSANMSGQVGILVSVQPKDVVLITDAIQAGRIVVVRHA